MSEATDRELDERVLAGVLAAVEDPALVCDAELTVRAWNDAFGDRTTTGATVAGAAVTEFLEWDGTDPVARALDGETTTAPARLAGDGRRYSVTARPIRERAAAVVTFAATPETDWPVYRAALNASPDNVYVFDTDLTFRAVSDGFESWTKIPTEEVTGESIDCLAEYGVLSQEGVERSRAALQSVFDGREDEVTLTVAPAMEPERVVESKIAPIRYEGTVVGAVVAIRDVTELERAVQARRRSQERLRTILDSLPVAMFVIDAEGRIDHVQGFDFSGLACDRTDLLGAPIEAFTDTYGGIVEGCKRALAGESRSTTATLGDRTYEVAFEPVREEGAVTGTIAVAMDVTDREERERELAATNERLDMALSNTEAGVFEWHVDEDRVYWHETTSRLFGLDPETSYRTPESFTEQVHPADRERVRAALDDAMATDDRLSVEYRVNDPGEKPRWFVSEGEFQYEDGEPVRMVGTVRDVTERKRRERELVEREQRLRAVIESSADPIVMQDTEGRYRVVNEAFVEVTDCPREELQGATPDEVFDDEAAERIERHRREVLSSEGARVAQERIQVGLDSRVVQVTVAPHSGPDGDVRGTVTLARDITELERQHEELETLTAIQELVQESVRGAATAETREAIKRSVCDRLADSPFYEGVWIGSRSGPNREITPDYTAGGIAAYLDEVSVTVDTGGRGQGPGGTAYRTGEVQVVDDVREDPSVELWREALLEHGFESIAVVPLTQGSTTHGILALYTDRSGSFTDRSGSFSDREVEGFETLGAAVGFALSAAQHRRLLESDRVLELEYAVESDQVPFVRASAEHDCRFIISDPVHARDGVILNYLTVEGADPALGERIAREHDDMVSIRRLEGDGAPHFEIKWRGSVFKYLVDAGARGVEGDIDRGIGRLSVEAPGDIDVRRVTEAVERRFGSVSLTAKREREQTDTPWWHAHGDIGAQLTDRQRDVLQAAYYSGYYEWPRETDGETLADSLDIATPTLLQHLRKGHRGVLEAMFDS